MKLLFDFFPILLFFIAFKIYGIYTATAIAMIASLSQVVFYRLKFQHYEKMHVISLIIIMVLGGATLFFHNPSFIKWKPTGIYWLSALIFISSSFIGNKPLIQKMMETNVNLTSKVWHRLNTAWSVFFIMMGTLNLYVAYNYDTDAWVNFKLFGGVGFTLIFVLIQAFYLTKHMDEKSLEKQQ
jgi:intracellular septation protein